MKVVSNSHHQDLKFFRTISRRTERYSGGGLFHLRKPWSTRITTHVCHPAQTAAKRK